MIVTALVDACQFTVVSSAGSSRRHDACPSSTSILPE
jgi:hypothetical protein